MAKRRAKVMIMNTSRRKLPGCNGWVSRAHPSWWWCWIYKTIELRGTSPNTIVSAPLRAESFWLRGQSCFTCARWDACALKTLRVQSFCFALCNFDRFYGDSSCNRKNYFSLCLEWALFRISLENMLVTCKYRYSVNRKDCFYVKG